MGVKLNGIGIKVANIPADAVYSIKVPMFDAGEPVLDAEGKQALTDRRVLTVEFEDGVATVPSKKVAEAMVEAYPQNITIAN